MKTKAEELSLAIINFCRNKVEITEIEKLIAEDADLINTPNHLGEAPIHIAIKFNSLETTELLIKSGADLEQLNAEGSSPLDLALNQGIKEKDVRIVNRLIANKVNTSGTNYLGGTLLKYVMYLAELGLMPQLVSVGNALLRAGADTQGCRFWYFDTRRHYKIWFSRNPEEFMDMENQLRLIKLGVENPSMILTLIYSSKCLNESANLELLQFCKANNINPVNFDTDILPLLNNPLDIQLYEKALEEIDRTISSDGGNFAAASDCIRLIVPIIAKFGMYNDFEKQLFIEAFPLLIQCLTPLVLNRASNDCIAVAVNPKNLTQLDDDAIAMIRNAQTLLLDNYKNYGKAILSSNFYKGKELSLYNHVTAQYINKHSDSTVFDLRKFSLSASLQDLLDLANDNFYKQFVGMPRNDSATEEELKMCLYSLLLKNHSLESLKNFNIGTGIELVDQQLKVIKENILTNSVVAISGPEVMRALFLNEFAKYKHFCGRDENFEGMFENDDINFKPTAYQQSKRCDGSWGPLGEKRKQIESEKIKGSILFFQKMIRETNARTESQVQFTPILS